jgi:hypothetical protein
MQKMKTNAPLAANMHVTSQRKLSFTENMKINVLVSRCPDFAVLVIATVVLMLLLGSVAGCIPFAGPWSPAESFFKHVHHLTS